MLTPDEASDLCEFLADCHEEFPSAFGNVLRFLPTDRELAADVWRGLFCDDRQKASDPLAYDVGVWCRENLV